MSIGKMIKFYRKENGLTQGELAEMIGVSTQAIYLPAFRKNAETYAENSIVPENFQRARTEAELILDTFENSPLDFSKEQ